MLAENEDLAYVVSSTGEYKKMMKTKSRSSLFFLFGHEKAVQQLGTDLKSGLSLIG
jgi:hypothetical protein